MNNLKKKKRKIISVPIIFFLFVYPSKIYPSPHQKINIKYCYDGDTCTTFKGEKIRLACIDTPELKGPKANPQKAKEAKEFLNNLIANEEVYIRLITKDKYGRTVGELFKNGANIQKLIVENGYGKIYEKYSHQCDWSR